MVLQQSSERLHRKAKISWDSVGFMAILGGIHWDSLGFTGIHWEKNMGM